MGYFEVDSVQLCPRLTPLFQQSPVDGTCVAVPAEEGLLAVEQHTPSAVAVDAESELQDCSKPEAEAAGIVGESENACIGERLQYYVADIL